MQYLAIIYFLSLLTNLLVEVKKKGKKIYLILLQVISLSLRQAAAIRYTFFLLSCRARIVKIDFLPRLLRKYGSQFKRQGWLAETGQGPRACSFVEVMAGHKWYLDWLSTTSLQSRLMLIKLNPVCENGFIIHRIYSLTRFIIRITILNCNIQDDGQKQPPAFWLDNKGEAVHSWGHISLYRTIHTWLLWGIAIKW